MRGSGVKKKVVVGLGFRDTDPINALILSRAQLRHPADDAWSEPERKCPPCLTVLASNLSIPPDRYM